MLELFYIKLKKIGFVITMHRHYKIFKYVFFNLVLCIATSCLQFVARACNYIHTFILKAFH